MSELSEAGADSSETGTGALVNGPESGRVVAAVAHLLEGATFEAREELRACAAESAWATVAHRLDVAGRALCADHLVDSDRASLVADHHDTGLATPEARALLEAWCDGGGVDAAIDLVTDHVDTRTEDDRCWIALAVLTWLVDRAGFPPEVVV